uniref:Alpha-amylase n=1 Tax=Rhipicephalus appendiculatus TaxID=34631 RepID=A0A131Z198_RHIAP
MFSLKACGPTAPSRQWIATLLVATACCLSHNVARAAERQFTDPGFMGDRTTIVELFEWAWPDVAQECEDFLGPFGYGAVQVSPPSENAFLLYTTPGGVSVRSWYERYEPVSYGIASPSGDLQEFADMVRRCNESHVRVFVDVVLNHMTSNIGSGYGYDGTEFNSEAFAYTGVYSAKDFHSHADCGTASGLVEDYSNVVQVRNCKFRGRADLNHMLESVRSRITGYLRQLLSLGVSGFRIDGADYMWPRDLDEIYKRLKEPDQTKVELFDVQPAAYRLMETPSDSESETLSETPSEEPSDTPSETPSETPSQTLSETPSDAPSETTSETPSETPSNTPSDSPSDTPPETPSSTLTEAPTDTQPDSPSDTPSDAPSDAPSDTPAVTAERTTADTETATNVRKRDTTVEQGGETVTPPRLASNFDGPFIYHEMSTLNLRWTEEYESIGAVTNATFFKTYANALNRVRERPLKSLRPFIMEARGAGKAAQVVYVDSHETQRGVDVNDTEGDVVTYRDRKRQVLATVLMLAQPHGVPRVMSSYALDGKFETYVPPKMLGPPFDHMFNTRPVLMRENFECYNGWICEHRWLPIRNMVHFRNWVGAAVAVNWWDDDADAVAFARLQRGFVLVNNGLSVVRGLFNTTLPAGYYCDVLSGSRRDTRTCSGHVVRVRPDGFAELSVDPAAEVPAVALHTQERVFPDYV